MLAVAGQDLKQAEQVLSDIKADRARALHKAQLAEKAKEKAKKLAKKRRAKSDESEPGACQAMTSEFIAWPLAPFSRLR